jgi:hypothetical protein
MIEVKRRVDHLLYLKTADKILTALANEYGADRQLPSRAFIQDKLNQHNAPRRPYGGRQAEGCEP